MYRKAMFTTGIGSAVVAAGYAAAATMAVAADAHLSPRVSGICLTLILGLCLMSYSAWLVQRANLGRDALADAVAERLATRLEVAMAAESNRSHSRTVAAFREIVTSELITEHLDAAVQRIHRLGMITEARGRADDAKVAQIRRT